MSQAELLLLVVRGINEVRLELKEMRGDHKHFVQVAEKVDNCPHCQNPGGIMTKKTFVVILVLLSTGMGSAVTKLVEVMAK